MPSSQTTYKSGAQWSGNRRGRPAGIVEKQPRNLMHFHNRALNVVKHALQEDDLRAATYVIDHNLGTAPQQSSAVEMLDVVLRYLERFPEAAEHLKSQLLSEPTQENAHDASENAP